MGDPLSIVASVTGLLALGLGVSKQVYTFVNDIKDAPSAITGVRDELSSLCSVLSQFRGSLKDDFADSPPYSIPVATDLCAVLDNCKKVLARLQTQMQKFTKYGRGTTWHAFLVATQYIFSEKEILRIQRSLEAYKSTLTITLLITVM
jgi:Fungal N-terminal domain of STAND proteins